MVQVLGYTFDAGVSKNIKTGASPLEINDVRKTALASDPVSQSALRTRGKVINVAGITGARTSSTKSVAYRY